MKGFLVKDFFVGAGLAVSFIIVAAIDLVLLTLVVYAIGHWVLGVW